MSASAGSTDRQDFLIVGAGIVGLTLARALRRRHPRARITVIEKEETVGVHASGRNSGVVHAGIYYEPGTLKAEFCRAGGRQLISYCEENGLPLTRCGKLILPTGGPGTLGNLEKLATRAANAGADIEIVDREGIRKIEPLCGDFPAALWSPRTAVVDPGAVLGRLRDELRAGGAEVQFSTKIVRLAAERREVHTTRGRMSYGHLFNAAGAGSLELAQAMGAGFGYDMVPFRGTYRAVRRPDGPKVRVNLYPVPDPRLPFLGIHATPSVNGTVYLGPTASPAFGGENYRLFSAVDWPHLPAALRTLAGLYRRNRNGFRDHVHREIRLLWPMEFWRQARRLIPSLERHQVTAVVKSGIRAQLIERRSGGMVQDFLIETGRHATHILNTVSPGLTSAFAVADHVVALASQERS